MDTQIMKVILRAFAQAQGINQEHPALLLTETGNLRSRSGTELYCCCQLIKQLVAVNLNNPPVLLKAWRIIFLLIKETFKAA